MTHTADSWPIACAMLPFGGTDSTGRPIQDAEPEEWARHLRLVRELGFTEIDPTDTWVRVGDLSPERLKEFEAVVADVGLRIPAISTSRRSVLDPRHGEEYLALRSSRRSATRPAGSTPTSATSSGSTARSSRCSRCSTRCSPTRTTGT